ncbi:SsgA family sporulation/cell division regulator [Streptomyces sp. NPDC004288]|uniref:SsgA family sporulation/cell division regulator n=1 Tax=Streptomyces sp. NPDC047141 TaxID=3155738 RepID=UPI0033E94BFC
MPQLPVEQLPTPRSLTRSMAMELLSADIAVEVETTVGYSSRDPFALSILFHLPGDAPVLWRIDREMLLAGVFGATGDGEVRVTPAPGGMLHLRLGVAGHCALVRCGQEQLARLVRDTFRLVPQGTEERHIDWQPLLDSLSH